MPSNGGAGVGSRAFRNLLRQVEQFTPHQIEDLISCANSIRRTREAHAEIEARTEQEHNCPFCGAEKRRKWGYTRTGIQRFQCGDCKKTFSGLTGTAVCGLHRHDLFLEAIRDMLSENPSSCRKLGRTLDVTKDTIWRWRMMVLRAMESVAMTEFSGIVEADECYQRESRKGSREWVQHAQNPTKIPAPPRLQWHCYKSGRIKMLRGLSRWQLPILTLADRSGARGMQRIANRRDATIYKALAPCIPKDVILCSDKLSGYGKFAQIRSLEHHVLANAPGKRVVGSAFHVQNVNSMHAAYRRFIRPFKGPASKYLGYYLGWFLMRKTCMHDNVLRQVMAS